MPIVIEVDHPLVAHRLGVLRDSTTPNATFRTTLEELSLLLVHEASRDLPTERVPIATPLAAVEARRITAPPLLVPVLRAGLGMLGGALRLLPDARVGFIGVKRDEATLRPDAYLRSVPDELAGLTVMVLDPMVATGGSLCFALQELRAAGAGRLIVVCVLAAPEGLARLDADGFADVTVVTAAVDERLDEVGYIVPGLGDAGDRQFGDY